MAEVHPGLDEISLFWGEGGDPSQMLRVMGDRMGPV